MIYLDNAATTKPDSVVVKAMLPYLQNEFGNAGSQHQLGIQARNAILHARKQVADFIGATPDQIIFTSGGTEANNLVFQGVSEYLKNKNKTHIITSLTEHDSVFKSVEKMCIKSDFYSTYLTPKAAPDGYIDFEDFCDKIEDNTGLVSIMYVNNETGAVNPIKEIGHYCREHGILFHTDCVQAAGCLPIDVNEIECDFLTISSHKIHGCKGMGALFIRDKSIINPIIFGGAMQEFGLRGGTENVAGIVGFGMACNLSIDLFGRSKYLFSRRVKNISSIFFAELKHELWEKGLECSSETAVQNIESPTGKILSVRFNGIDAETLLLALSSQGICASAGSACRSLEQEPSRVLIASGLTPEQARSTIRFSFSENNSLEEIINAARQIAESTAILSGKE